MTNLQTTTTSTAPVFHLPDLVAIQRSSFRWFLEEGLIEELNSFSPITDYTGKLELHFIGRNYKLKEPKYSVDESKRRDSSYAVQMYVPTRLINKETGEIKEQEVFIGDLPLMTERGTFIINGAERVIVNQIVCDRPASTTNPTSTKTVVVPTTPPSFPTEAPG